MGKAQEFQTIVRTNLDFVILNGQTVSAAVAFSGTTLLGLVIPVTAGFTDATLSFQISDSLNGVYADYFNTDDVAVSFAATGGANPKHYGIIPVDLAGVHFVKLVSSIAQAQDTTIKVFSRPV